MINFIGGILAVIGAIGLWATIPVSILYAIYSIFVLQAGFFSGVFMALLLAVTQFVVSWLIVIFGGILVSK